MVNHHNHALAQVTWSPFFFLPQSYLPGKTPTLVEMNSLPSLRLLPPSWTQEGTHFRCAAANTRNQTARLPPFSSPAPKKSFSNLFSLNLQPFSPLFILTSSFAEKNRSNQKETSLGWPQGHYQLTCRGTLAPPVSMFGQSVRGQPLHFGIEPPLLSLLKHFLLAVFPSLCCIIICATCEPLLL